MSSTSRPCVLSLETQGTLMLLTRGRTRVRVRIRVNVRSVAGSGTKDLCYGQVEARIQRLHHFSPYLEAPASASLAGSTPECVTPAVCEWCSVFR